jgi:signal transduction histidine kinase
LNLLITLPVGILLVIIMFFLLQRFVTRTPLRTGFSAAVLTSVLYVGYTIPFWPGGDVFAVHIALFLITIYILSITGHQRMKSGVVSRRLHWAPATIIGIYLSRPTWRRAGLGAAHSADTRQRWPGGITFPGCDQS